MTRPDPPPTARALALSEDLRNAFKRLVREMRRDVERQDTGLSMLQTMLLAAIGERPGIGVAALARMQQVRSPTMSAQVKALVDAGLVARAAPDAADRRRTGLVLTEAGTARVQALRAHRLDWLAQRVARLTPAQMDQLSAAIEPLNLIARP
ncbi:MarR family winged helix-turn-helix transcriptional regulator [uncultured Massilia sp.]|uniref:MarR family winged helix-turn-helix transcriptional regulator n=1 Tax=uncultured Massilia sp. TaxID=169973 RepID=UPI0025F16527|nr:MarR family transcriptional regulator [uncultured Massilia sp.]